MKRPRPLDQSQEESQAILARLRRRRRPDQRAWRRVLPLDGRETGAETTAHHQVFEAPVRGLTASSKRLVGPDKAAAEEPTWRRISSTRRAAHRVSDRAELGQGCPGCPDASTLRGLRRAPVYCARRSPWFSWVSCIAALILHPKPDGTPAQRKSAAQWRRPRCDVAQRTWSATLPSAVVGTSPLVAAAVQVSLPSVTRR